jgi:hypothetical protein
MTYAAARHAAVIRNVGVEPELAPATFGFTSTAKGVNETHSFHLQLQLGRPDDRQQPAHRRPRSLSLQ